MRCSWHKINFSTCLVKVSYCYCYYCYCLFALESQSGGFYEAQGFLPLIFFSATHMDVIGRYCLLSVVLSFVLLQGGKEMAPLRTT